MATNTITSADAVFMLSIAGLYPAPQQLQGYAADDMFTTAAIKPVELQMGADGILVAGWVPVMKEMTIMLLASSVSVALFETWDATETSGRIKLPASGIIVLNSTGAKYTLSNGYLSEVSPMPDAKKVLQPRRFGITWQGISAAPR